MDSQIFSNIKIHCNCFVQLIGENETITKIYDNSVYPVYLAQFAKEIISETQSFSPEIKIIELRDLDNAFISRKSYAERWNTGAQAVYIFYFAANEGNGNIGHVRFFCDTATTTESTGTAASQILTDVAKTTDYRMNVIYTFGFQNA